MFNNGELRKKLSNEKIAKLDLKGVLLSDLILEYQNQNSILSYAHLERVFMTVIAKTKKQFKNYRQMNQAQATKFF